MRFIKAGIRCQVSRLRSQVLGKPQGPGVSERVPRNLTPETFMMVISEAAAEPISLDCASRRSAIAPYLSPSQNLTVPADQAADFPGGRLHLSSPNAHLQPQYRHG